MDDPVLDGEEQRPEHDFGQQMPPEDATGGDESAGRTGGKKARETSGGGSGGSRPAGAPTPPAAPSGDEPDPAEPAAAPEQPPAPEPPDPSDDLEDAGQKFGAIPFPSDDLGPELEARIDSLAPAFPPYVQTDDERERWAYCARAATMVAMNEFGSDGDSEISQFAWSAARSFYKDPESYPMPSETEASAMRVDRGQADVDKMSTPAPVE